MVDYQLKRVIRGHLDSVNVLAFSPDKVFCVSGGEDGLVWIFTSDFSKEIRRWEGASAITSLSWSDRFKHTVLIGVVSGDIHTIRLGFTEGMDSVATEHISTGQISTIAQHGTDLAVACGKSVFLYHRSNISSWTNRRELPPPPLPYPDSKKEDPVRRSLGDTWPCGLAFVEDILVVAYVAYGVIGWSIPSKSQEFDAVWRLVPRACRIGGLSISPEGTTVVITNLYDGLDWYTVPRSKYGQPHHVLNTVLPMGRDNVRIPLLHIHNGSTVLVGSSTGKVRLIDVNHGRTLQTLEHGETDKIQALVYAQTGGRERRIVTAVSEGGSQNVIRMWVAEDDSRLVQRLGAWFKTWCTCNALAARLGYLMIIAAFMAAVGFILVRTTKVSVPTFSVWKSPPKSSDFVDHPILRNLDKELSYGEAVSYTPLAVHTPPTSDVYMRTVVHTPNVYTCTLAYSPDVYTQTVTVTSLWPVAPSATTVTSVYVVNSHHPPSFSVSISEGVEVRNGPHPDQNAVGETDEADARNTRGAEERMGAEFGRKVQVEYDGQMERNAREVRADA
ncbi:WD40-repeat-containing domain protein [Amylostereum chailletii]|nr:WD40-repeat-containing domain protein [Amylostereum chailletii]